MTLISPSILSADFARLGAEVKAVTQAGADLIHLDIMDGHFVPNLTFGPMIIKDIRPYSALPFDVHLMMTNPRDFMAAFAAAGADLITVHVEATDDVADLIALIRKEGKKVGLSIRPGTKIATLIPYIPLIDLILVMSVEPGFGGQSFQPTVLERIAGIKEFIGRKKVLVSVDGGINAQTAPACIRVGADILVAGSFVFKQRSYQKAIEQLKNGE